MIGSLISSTIGGLPDRAIDRLLARAGALPAYDDYTFEAEQRLEKADTNGAFTLANDELARRRRMQSDYDFRRTFMWVWLVPSTILTARFGWVWLLTFIPSFLLLIDALTIGWRVRKWMRESQMEEWVHEGVHAHNASGPERSTFLRNALDHWPAEDNKRFYRKTRSEVQIALEELESKLALDSTFNGRVG